MSVSNELLEKINRQLHDRSALHIICIIPLPRYIPTVRVLYLYTVKARRQLYTVYKYNKYIYR